MRFARKTNGAMRPSLAGRRRGGEEGDDGMIPLINIVFLLLIFFMLAGKLTQADPFQITPPLSQSSALPDAAPGTILVGAEGQLALAGQAMEIEALIEAVKALKAEDLAAALRLKADEKADAGQVITVMERLREAGIERLLLLTTTLPAGGA
ncbi:MAG: biopolymer transporter ExbD [Alphaproteobacteria bacterium]|nr:biopolymer transporter ExbD [Alphaproteobacteria bacterium]